MNKVFRRRSVPWYGPSLVAFVICISLIGLVYYIDQQKIEEQRSTLQTDFEFIDESIGFRLSSTSDFLQLIADEIQNGTSEQIRIKSSIARYRETKSEIQSFQFINIERQPEWTVPSSKDVLMGVELHRSPVLNAFQEAIDQDKAVFSKIYHNYFGNPAISIFIPISHKGALGCEIDVNTLLKNTVKDGFKKKYKMEFLANNPNSSKVEGELPYSSNILSHSAALEKTGENLYLRLSRHHTKSNHWFTLISILCIGLAFGLAWAMWDQSKDTMRKERIREELEKAKNSAEAANNAKNQLIANISHEIRTPLGAIQGFADLLADFDLSSQEKNNSIQSIRRNSRHLLEIINDLLDISKIEAGLLEIRMDDFFIGKLIDEVIYLFTPSAKQKGIDLKTMYSGPIPKIIQSDRHRIQQILTNLLGNAIKFTENGVITISTEFTQEEPEKIHLTFRVRDTGIGIEQESLPMLFQQFKQADSSIQRTYGGTGLGLYLTRKIANKLNGNVTLEWTEVGEGSCFLVQIEAEVKTDMGFYLDASEIDLEKFSIVKDNKNRTKDLEGVRVLVVDDCRDNQLIYTQFLEFHGANIDTADDGKEAIQLTGRNMYDAIIMDVQMPNLDGLSATRSIRQSEIKTPIIILTAHAMKGEKQRCLEAGANDYLSKPIDPDTLIKAVAKSAKRKSRVLEKHSQKSPCEMEPLLSKFSEDPNFIDVIPIFVNGLRKRVSQINSAIEREDTVKLKALAHQLKGTANNYGYSEIAKLASQLERIPFTEVCSSNILDVFNELKSLCQRARAGLEKYNRHSQ